MQPINVADDAVSGRPRSVGHQPLSDVPADAVRGRPDCGAPPADAWPRHRRRRGRRVPLITSPGIDYCVPLGRAVGNREDEASVRPLAALIAGRI